MKEYIATYFTDDQMHDCSKLFLFKLFFEVDDIVTTPRGIGKILAIHTGGIPKAWVEFSDSTSETVYFSKLKLALGPISPQAKWVVAGDEFTADELKPVTQKRHICRCEKPNVYRSPKQNECKYMVSDHSGGDFCIHQEDVVAYVMVKGPCGHFH